MPIHPRSARILEDLHDLPSALGLGSHQDKLAAVIEGRRVCLDYVVGQMIVGKMGFKGPNNGMLVPLGYQIGCVTAQNHLGSRAPCKGRNRRIDAARLFCHDGLIVNSVVKSGGSQSLDEFSPS
jgi:hypothetical protein